MGLGSTEQTRILVVEDNPINQKVVTRMLERLGCVVEVAEDGLVGIDMAQKGPALILMDCSMPRCDGFEATQRIRALGNNIATTPIVAVTAHASPADRERCLASGMDDWLTKPVGVNDLINVLLRYTVWTEKQAAAPMEVLLDKKVIDQLLALSGEDDPEFFDMIVEEFQGTSQEVLQDVRSCNAPGTITQFRNLILRLKNACETIGANRLRDTCARLEATAEADVLAQHPSLIAHLERDIKNTLTALKQTAAKAKT